MGRVCIDRRDVARPASTVSTPPLKRVSRPGFTSYAPSAAATERSSTSLPDRILTSPPPSVPAFHLNCLSQVPQRVVWSAVLPPRDFPRADGLVSRACPQWARARVLSRANRRPWGRRLFAGSSGDSVATPGRPAGVNRRRRRTPDRSEYLQVASRGELNVSGAGAYHDAAAVAADIEVGLRARHHGARIGAPEPRTGGEAQRRRASVHQIDALAVGRKAVGDVARDVDRTGRAHRERARLSEGAVGAREPPVGEVDAADLDVTCTCSSTPGRKRNRPPGFSDSGQQVVTRSAREPTSPGPRTPRTRRRPRGGASNTRTGSTASSFTCVNVVPRCVMATSSSIVSDVSRLIALARATARARRPPGRASKRGFPQADPVCRPSSYRA